MDISTPLNRNSIGGRDLHRRTILKNAVEASPLRRRSLVQVPLASLENVDDENERSSRRSLIDMQRRVSNIPHGTPMNESNKFLGEQDMKDHFQICTKLFTENKITPKNAWKLHIIDLLRHIAQKQGTDTLQVAGTSLDISAKVYSIRVDDIHSDGLKLAGSMSRVSEKELPQDLDDNVNSDGEECNEKAAAKKNKKKRFLARNRNTVSTDPRTLNGRLPKLDSVFFSTRTDNETSAIDNLFTNRLKMDNSGFKFILLSNEKSWTEQPDPVVREAESSSKRKYPLTINPLTNMKICVPFNDFELDEWDPDEEEKQLALQKSSFLEKQQEVIFDDDGVPMHELDGSIHDIFENPPDEAEDDIQSIHEEVAPQIRGEIEKIVEFRPDLTDGTLKSEYSYNPVVTTYSGKLIDQIWAGPSHWKLKFIRRSTARFSGQVVQEKQVRSGRKRTQPKMIDFDMEYEEFDMSNKLKIKKKPPSVDIHKITLPVPDSSCIKLMEHINELMTKPGVCPVKKKAPGENQVDYEVGAYRYENPNDSQYCSQHSSDPNGDNMAHPFDDNDDCDDIEEHRVAQQEFLGENLVDAPEMIPKSYVTYALQAKKMDMKKLKSAVWQNLTHSTIITNTQDRGAKVIPTTFSKMFKELPDLLSQKMQQELSCSLAFVALLHLCNEQNLALKQHPGYKDFDIKGP